MNPGAGPEVARTTFSIAPGHPSLPGHFPGRPVVPGVLVLAQVVAAAEQHFGVVDLRRLGQVKFLRPLLPGEDAEVTLQASGGSVRFRVLRGEVLLATGELAFLP